jgi:hypothetical protein
MYLSMMLPEVQRGAGLSGEKHWGAGTHRRQTVSSSGNEPDALARESLIHPSLARRAQ